MSIGFYLQLQLTSLPMINEMPQHQRRFLRRPLQSLVICKSHSKSWPIAIRPLKIVHQRPRKIPLNNRSIFTNRPSNRVKMIFKVLNPILILHRLLTCHFVLSRTRTSVLCDDDRFTVKTIYPREMFTEEVWARSEPVQTTF